MLEYSGFAEARFEDRPGAQLFTCVKWRAMGEPARSGLPAKAERLCRNGCGRLCGQCRGKASPDELLRLVQAFPFPLIPALLLPLRSIHVVQVLSCHTLLFRCCVGARASAASGRLVGTRCVLLHPVRRCPPMPSRGESKRCGGQGTVLCIAASSAPDAGWRCGWCPEGDLNPHDLLGSADFKSAVSADFTIRAGSLT